MHTKQKVRILVYYLSHASFVLPINSSSVAVFYHEKSKTKPCSPSDEIMKRVKEAGFHIAARKETELTKDIAEQFYQEHADKEYYNDLVEHMTRYLILCICIYTIG